MRRNLAAAAVATAALAALAGCADRQPKAVLERAGGGLRVLGSASVAASVPEAAELGEKSGLADYLAYAALNNPGLEAAFNRWKTALERIPQVRALPDPRFSYRYYIQEVETRVGPQRQAFGLAQTFPAWGKLALQGEVAAEEAEAARARYEAEKLALFYRVTHAYYEYDYLARSVDVVRDNRDLLRQFEQVVRTRYAAAAAGHPDLIRAQVELGRLDDRLRTLLDLRGATVSRLNAALGRPLDAELPWPKATPPEPVRVADAELLAWLPEASPELRAMDHEVEKQRRSIELARKERWPDVSLGVDVIDTREALMPGMRDSGKDPVMAMISLNIPIWFDRLAAAEREARARHLAAAKARADRQNLLGAQARLALYHFRDAERKIDLYGDTLVPKAKESLGVTQGAFIAGKASFLDLLDAERALLEFQVSYERARADRAQRLAEIEMLVGREIPRVDGGPPGSDNRSGAEN